MTDTSKVLWAVLIVIIGGIMLAGPSSTGHKGPSKSQVIERAISQYN